MHNPYWVACSDHNPSNTRLYVAKLASGQICKAHYKRGKGGYWDDIYSLIPEQEPIVEYWLSEFPPRLINNLALNLLESYLKELKLC